MYLLLLYASDMYPESGHSASKFETSFEEIAELIAELVLRCPGKKSKNRI
jgi:hypothetical protein